VLPTSEALEKSLDVLPLLAEDDMLNVEVDGSLVHNIKKYRIFAK